MGRISPKPGTSLTALDVGDDTNYTEIKDDGEINLHGTARVLKHIDIQAINWHRGASAPTEGDIGVYHTLMFDDSTDDEIHSSIIAPHDLASGSTINVIIYWTYTGAQNNGTVKWALEYKNVAEGEAVDGGETTISATSAGNHPTGDLVKTTLVTGITGAVVNDIIGLHLSRDVSEDTLTTDAHLLEVHFEYIADKLGEAT